MIYIIIIVIIVLFLINNCKQKENFCNYKILRDHRDFFIDEFDIEKTPYSHHTQDNYLFYDYRRYCDPNDPGSCMNGRCIYKSLNECQDKCKTGCQGCGRFGLYMCNLQ
jgi:hypothetical protein